MAFFSRKSKLLSATVPLVADIANATVIPISRFTMASIQLPAGSGTTQITVYARLGTNAFGAARDEDRIPIVFTVEALVPQPLPSAVYAFQDLQLIASGGRPVRSLCLLT